MNNEWTVKDTVEAKVASIPPCDFCGKPAQYDAATTQGPWAYMCEIDFRRFGKGVLGLGKGQRLVLDDAF